MNIYRVWAAFALYGCSYSFTGGSVPPEIKTVAVKVFQSEAPALSPTLAQEFTEALRNRFQTQTKLVLVRDDGDWTLEGSITEYAVSPITVQQDRAAQNRLTMTVSVQFTVKDRPDGGWKQTFSNFVDFPAEEDFAANETKLLGELTEKLVQDVFNKTLSNW
ncbi:MAG: LptE family protein [Bacteroidia bacterium]|nr:LPS assembly lipoprotein LptE [Bacteroidia bacterium]MDW8334520.1 LptE family protein [Bacteroidia bacterium]